MDNTDLLKKYAINYLSKYDSTKKNLERILINKIMRIKNIETNQKNHLFTIIHQLIENLESKKIINDEIYANKKIISLFHKGKSEIFIKNTLMKKGVDKKILNTALKEFEKKYPSWKIESAKKFASKKKLGKYGNTKNKEKDLSKMSRAGFDYKIAIKALGLD